MQFCSWLLLSLLSYHITSIEGLFFWRPSSAFAKQPEYKASIGEYILQAFDGPAILEAHQAQPPTIQIKRMALAKRGNDFHGATAAQPKQTSSVALQDDGTDFSYFSQVSIGSKGDKFWMLMDTGSPSSWVMGADCTSTACTTHTTFGDKDSNTLKITQEPFTIQYGTGAVEGVVISDTMQLADMSLRISFGSATKVSDHFINNPIDGIIGLGRAKSNSMGVPIFMDVVGGAKVLPAKLFGFSLQRASDGTNDGEINFGSPDTTKYTGRLSFTDTVSDQVQWEIPIEDAIVNGVPCKLTGNTAIIDTGTSYMLLPPDDAKVLHAQIPNSQSAGASYHIPCSTTVSIEVVFSKVAYSISPKDYIGAPIQGGNLCQSQIIGYLTGGPDQWLLGDTFMKNVYTVFDMDNARIGFGVKNKGSSSLLPESSTPLSTPSSTQASSASLASLTYPSTIPPAALSTSSSILTSIAPVVSSGKSASSTDVPSSDSLPSLFSPQLPASILTTGSTTLESAVSPTRTCSFTASAQEPSIATSSRSSTASASVSTAASSDIRSVAAAFGNQGLWVIALVAFLKFSVHC